MKSIFGFLAFAFCCASLANADSSYTFSWSTTPLVGNGPFTLDFQFLDGSGLPIDLNNNTVSLTSFGFGTGGSASGGGTASGGASGSLSTGVTLNDTVFLNEYYENFTPGSLLSFTIDTTNVADPGGTPDLFTLAILDNMGDELPTTGPASEFLDISLAGGANPVVATFGSAPGSAYALSAPTVELQTGGPSPVPEPSSYSVLLTGLMGLGFVARRARRSKVDR